MKSQNGTKNKTECNLFIMSSVCACLAPVVSGLSSRAQQHHIDMKIAPQIIFYENVARGSGSIIASSNVISIPQSCIIFVSSVMDHLLWWVQKSKIFCTSIQELPAARMRWLSSLDCMSMIAVVQLRLLCVRTHLRPMRKKFCRVQKHSNRVMGYRVCQLILCITTY